jgi:hypothetical protein
LLTTTKIVIVVCRVKICALRVLRLSLYSNLQNSPSEYDDTAFSILEEYNESY